jgi:hypothetical protein
MAKTSKEDAQILTLLNRVREQKKVVERADKPKWETNCTLPFKGRAVNLHTVNDIQELAEMAGFIAHESTQLNTGYEALGVVSEERAPYKLGGFTSGQWLCDLQTRQRKLGIAREKEKLKSLEERLDKLVSPEKRREMELAAIMEEMS